MGSTVTGEYWTGEQCFAAQQCHKADASSVRSVSDVVRDLASGAASRPSVSDAREFKSGAPSSVSDACDLRVARRVA